MTLNTAARLLATFVIVMICTVASQAQEKPCPTASKFGPEDQVGNVNHITPAKTLAASKLVTTGKTYRLAIETNKNTPAFGTRTFSITVVQPGQLAGTSLGPNKATYKSGKTTQQEISMQTEQKLTSTAPTSLSEYDAITRTVQIYINGGKTGRGADMKPAFHPDATIFGYVGADLFAGPIQQLYDWNDQNGPATDLQSRITNVDIIGTIATVRLELDNWTGHRFTDLFTLLKVDGEWKIMNKVFYLHP